MDPEVTTADPEVQPAGEVLESAPVEEAPPAAWYEGVDEAQAKTALDFHQRVQTEEGAMQTFFELGRAFGFGVKEIESWFTGPGAAPAPQEPAKPEPAADDWMTYGQFKEMMAAQINPLAQSFQQQQQAAVEAQARAAVDATIRELGIADESTKAAILQLGDRYLGNDLSPSAVANAVRRGHADFTSLVESEMKRRTASKADVARNVPSAPSGSAAQAHEPEAEAQSVKEAIARARKRLLGQA